MATNDEIYQVVKEYRQALDDAFDVHERAEIFETLCSLSQNEILRAEQFYQTLSNTNASPQRPLPHFSGPGSQSHARFSPARSFENHNLVTSSSAIFRKPSITSPRSSLSSALRSGTRQAEKSKVSHQPTQNQRTYNRAQSVRGAVTIYDEQSSFAPPPPRPREDSPSFTEPGNIGASLFPRLSYTKAMYIAERSISDQDDDIRQKFKAMKAQKQPIAVIYEWLYMRLEEKRLKHVASDDAWKAAADQRRALRKEKEKKRWLTEAKMLEASTKTLFPQRQLRSARH